MTNLTIGHLLVMLSCLISITVLGALHVLTEGTLSSLLSVVVGTVFGAAISQAATNGTTKSVVDAALERGSIIEQDARQRAVRQERQEVRDRESSS